MTMAAATCCRHVFLLCLFLAAHFARGYNHILPNQRKSPTKRLSSHFLLVDGAPHRHRVTLHLRNNDGKDEAQVEEEARLKILESRRYQIRDALKSAETIRNFRFQQGWVPELDEEGKPKTSDGKLAVTLTAFVVAAGAIALRIGGRAALISAVGLDFANDNPELKENLEQILTTAETMDLTTKLLLFTAGWAAVKTFCFDAGGVVLALASGILFGGVLQGAVISAAAATLGSSIAFGMAKLDTPVRKKALEVLDEYPSLRGIEKTVARDGLKAILTLRLAPILPIPLGLYNYIYGVTNVPFAAFAGGIFLGSLKPYLLDSYLGYFGKNVIEGTNEDGFQDVLLLAALGLSVLIGVFASQLAGETWESVLAEVEAEKNAKLGDEDSAGEATDGLTREFLGLTLPNWMIEFQVKLKESEDRVTELIAAEYEAKVWNYTKEEGGPPPALDPAVQANSPELQGAYQGVDFASLFYDGLVFGPALFAAVTKLADPLLYQEKYDGSALQDVEPQKETKEDSEQRTELMSRLQQLREEAVAKIELIDDRLQRRDTEM